MQEWLENEVEARVKARTETLQKSQAEESEGFETVGGDKTDRQKAREKAYKKKRPHDKLFTRDFFIPGLVFSTAYYEQDYDPAGKLGDKTHFTETSVGGVQGKYRKMVVVRQFDSHCVALPIFTYQGQGFLRKGINLMDHIGIRDKHDKRPAPGSAKSRYPALLATKRKKFDSDKSFHAILPASLVHLTLPFSFRYQFRATPEAQLDDNETKRLLEIFQKQMNL